MKHKPRKRFGQHFLQDAYYQRRVADSVNVAATEKLVEIGPGQGAITGHLLQLHGRVTAIEMDTDLAAALQRKYADQGLDLIVEDVLKVDFSALAKGSKLAMIGNLPYNISTPLIFHLLDALPVISQMVFMLQKEVVDRIVAPPGTKTYGRLSVMMGAYLNSERLFDVPPGAFFPQPKVMSTVVRLWPNERQIGAQTQQRLSQIVRAAFAQRRKTLRNALKEHLAEAQIKSAGIDPSLRPECLSVDDYLTLAQIKIG